MKVCIHSNQFDGRGTGKIPYDYGIALRRIFGYDVCFMTSGQSANEKLDIIQKEFPVYIYSSKVDVNPSSDVRSEIENLVDSKKIDFIHMIKYGINDNITPTNCKSGIHYVFKGHDPHGNAYAAVSQNLAKKYNSTNYVPHIIKKYPQTESVRRYLNIPKDAIVIGRHGGYDTFDIPFVYKAIMDTLNKRSDIYFIFLSTKPFIQHERVFFFDWTPIEQGIYNFIHGCDAMLHGRSVGETFGLAVGEFSACNKPVITWHGLNNDFYDTAHIDHLNGKAILYKDGNDLFSILSNIKQSDFLGKNWDTFTDTFSDENVMKLYDSVFLKSV